MDSETPLPAVDSKTGIYTDLDGIQWATAYWFQLKYGKKVISQIGLKTILDKYHSIRGRGRNGRETRLYCVEPVLAELENLLDLPMVNPETKEYRDNNGFVWTTQSHLSYVFNLAGKTVCRHMGDAKTIIGRDSHGRKVVLYEKEEARLRCETLVALPQIDGSGKLTDNSGVSWITIGALKQDFFLHRHTLRKILRWVSTIRGKDHRRSPLTLFNETEARAKLSEYFSIPRLDSDGKIPVDSDDGQRLISLPALVKKYKGRSISRETIKKLTETLPFIAAQTRKGFETRIVNEFDACRLIEDYLSVPLLTDHDITEYQDDEGKIWVSESHIRLQYPSIIKNMTIRGHLKDLPQREFYSDRYGRHRRIFYEKETALERLRTFGLLPLFSRVDGIHTDAEGKEWAVKKYFTTQVNGNVRWVYQDVVTKTGRDANTGYAITLYPVGIVQERMRFLNTLPRVDKESKKYVDPEGKCWSTILYFAQKYGVDHKKIKSHLQDIRCLEGRDVVNNRAMLYAEEDIDKLFRDLRKQRQLEPSKEKLTEFLGATHPAESEFVNFHNLIALFGASHATDILFSFRPDFRGLPIEYVQSALAEYLGDFLAETPPSPTEIPREVLPYLLNSNLREALLTVVKEHCLSFYHEQRRQFISVS